MQRGDHLISPRSGYSHHGIYLGRDKVIHYTGFSSGRHQGKIAITSLDEFCADEGFSIQSYPFRMYTHDESAKRALSRVGEDWYDILLNNCEHFVTWCILGVHHSHQTDRLIAAAELSRKLLSTSTKPSTTTALTTLSQKAIEAMARKIESTMPAPVIPGNSSTLLSVAAGVGATGPSLTVAEVTGFSIAAVTPMVATIGVGIAVGYGVKKLADWIWD